MMSGSVQDLFGANVPGPELPGSAAMARGDNAPGGGVEETKDDNVFTGGTDLPETATGAT